MPAVSKKQQKFMGIVHGLQKGTVKPSEVSKKAQNVAKTMKPNSATDFASTKHKGLPTKVKKPKQENSIGEIYAVKKPGKDATLEGLMFELDPFEGLAPHGIASEEVHGVYQDQKEAQKVAETLYAEYEAKGQALEEKKGAVTGKISSAIDALEKKRKEHVDMAKADPKNTSTHKEKIAQLATRIDDLMTKLEKVERSKKEKAQDDKKKVVKESIDEAEPNVAASTSTLAKFFRLKAQEMSKMKGAQSREILGLQKLIDAILSKASAADVAIAINKAQIVFDNNTKNVKSTSQPTQSAGSANTAGSFYGSRPGKEKPTNPNATGVAKPAANQRFEGEKSKMPAVPVKYKK